MTTAEPAPRGRDAESGCATAAARIYLTGFMAAGKTAVGRALAAILDRRFIDLDREIEACAGASIEEIFELQGEAAFRDFEHQALERTAAVRRAVIATGGGAMAFERNRELIRRLGTSVWLDPGIEIILARIDEEGRRRRPLFGDPEQARILHRVRLAAYARADLRIEVAADETAEKVAARIAAFFEGACCVT